MSAFARVFNRSNRSDWMNFLRSSTLNVCNARIIKKKEKEERKERERTG